MTVLPLASVRTEIADFLAAFLLVYTILIIAWIVASLVFAFGARVPYSRASNAILDFLRDVTEPYLRLFRSIIPPLGPLDLSPMIAILVLQIVGGILVSIIRG